MSSEPAGASEAPRTESLALLLDLVRGAPEAQLRTQEALDAKGVATLSAGGVTFGLATIGGFQGDPPTAGVVLLLVALVAFVILAALVMCVVRPRKFDAARSADTLWKLHAYSAPDAIRIAVLDRTAEAYAHNKD